MPLTDNPHVRSARKVLRLTLPDPRIKEILIVETDLPLRSNQDGYDAAALELLKKAVMEDLARSSAEEAQIVGASQ